MSYPTFVEHEEGYEPSTSSNTSGESTVGKVVGIALAVPLVGLAAVGAIIFSPIIILGAIASRDD